MYANPGISVLHTLDGSGLLDDGFREMNVVRFAETHVDTDYSDVTAFSYTR
jgi:kynureninase